MANQNNVHVPTEAEDVVFDDVPVPTNTTLVGMFNWDTYPDKDIPADVIPVIFNPKNGYLPTGFHTWNHPTLAYHCVSEHPKSTNRPAIFSGYQELLSVLNLFKIECLQWIGGSFVTNNENPGDIDLLHEFDYGALDNLPAEHQTIISAYLSGKITREICHCDSYYISQIPEDHPKHEEYVRIREYWIDYLGTDRDDNPKGIVTIAITPPQEPEPDAQDDDAATTA